MASRYTLRYDTDHNNSKGPLTEQHKRGQPSHKTVHLQHKRLNSSIRSFGVCAVTIPLLKPSDGQNRQHHETPKATQELYFMPVFSKSSQVRAFEAK